MIQIDANGWIMPQCPHCDGMMELNYHRWTTAKRVDADLNMYCRYCHYAVSIEPSTTDKNLKKTELKVEIYNESHYDREEELVDDCICKEDNIVIDCPGCF